MTNSIKLRCKEAYTRDVGRGHIRIDYESMEKLKISSSNIVEIKGKRKSLAKVLPLIPDDERKKIARTDSILRENMELSIDDEIEITKIKTEDGILIVVNSADELPPIDERYLRDAFEGYPMASGDYIMLPYFGGRLKFQIVRTDPEGAVVVTRLTNFLIVCNNKDKKIACPTCGSLV